MGFRSRCWSLDREAGGEGPVEKWRRRIERVVGQNGLEFRVGKVGVEGWMVGFFIAIDSDEELDADLFRVAWVDGDLVEGWEACVGLLGIPDASVLQMSLKSYGWAIVSTSRFQEGDESHLELDALLRSALLEAFVPITSPRNSFGASQDPPQERRLRTSTKSNLGKIRKLQSRFPSLWGLDDKFLRRDARVSGKVTRGEAPHCGSYSAGFRISKESLSEAHVVGQVDAKFIAIVASGQLLLVDQHAADERIRLENLLRLSDPSKSVSSFYVKPRIIVHLNSEQGAALREGTDLLRQWGWLVDCGAHREADFEIVAVPVVFGVVQDDVEIFFTFISELPHGMELPRFVHDAAAMAACKSSIRFGDSVTEEQCEKVIIAEYNP